MREPLLTELIGKPIKTKKQMAKKKTAYFIIRHYDQELGSSEAKKINADSNLEEEYIARIGETMKKNYERQQAKTARLNAIVIEYMGYLGAFPSERFATTLLSLYKFKANLVKFDNTINRTLCNAVEPGSPKGSIYFIPKI
jgi:hypothetical protein